MVGGGKKFDQLPKNAIQTIDFQGNWKVLGTGGGFAVSVREDAHESAQKIATFEKNTIIHVTDGRYDPQASSKANPLGTLWLETNTTPKALKSLKQWKKGKLYYVKAKKSGGKALLKQEEEDAETKKKKEEEKEEAREEARRSEYRGELAEHRQETLAAIDEESRTELGKLRVHELQGMALTEGVAEEEIDAALERKDFKAALVECIVERRRLLREGAAFGDTDVEEQPAKPPARLEPAKLAALEMRMDEADPEVLEAYEVARAAGPTREQIKKRAAQNQRQKKRKDATMKHFKVEEQKAEKMWKRGAQTRAKDFAKTGYAAAHLWELADKEGQGKVGRGSTRSG